MSIATPPSYQTVADLLKQLGGVPASRVRMVPTPGTATEKDVVRIHDRDGPRLHRRSVKVWNDWFSFMSSSIRARGSTT